jgi:hypothetical protein
MGTDTVSRNVDNKLPILHNNQPTKCTQLVNYTFIIMGTDTVSRNVDNKLPTLHNNQPTKCTQLVIYTFIIML